MRYIVFRISIMVHVHFGKCIVVYNFFKSMDYIYINRVEYVFIAGVWNIVFLEHPVCVCVCVRFGKPIHLSAYSCSASM